MHKKTEDRHRREAALIQSVVDQAQFIDEIGDKDILSGRGNGSSHAVGNRRFREIVNYERCQQYINVTDKNGFQETLYQEITGTGHGEHGMRFLLHVPDINKWIHQPKKLALKKIANRLRDAKDDGGVSAPRVSGPSTPRRVRHDGNNTDTPMHESMMKIPPSPSSAVMSPTAVTGSCHTLPVMASQTRHASAAAMPPSPFSSHHHQAGIIAPQEPHRVGMVSLPVLPIAGPDDNGQATASATLAAAASSPAVASTPQSPSSLLLPMLLASLNEDTQKQQQQHAGQHMAPPEAFSNKTKHLMDELSSSVVHRIAEAFGNTNTMSH